MVGHHARQHHVSKRKEEYRQNGRRATAHANHLTHYTVEKQHGVETPEQLHCRDNEDSTVLSGQRYEHLVKQIHRINEESKQWMTVNIISCRPV